VGLLCLVFDEFTKINKGIVDTFIDWSNAYIILVRG